MRSGRLVDVDAESLVADSPGGPSGPTSRPSLRGGYGLTLGHWPQSMDLSTVGGWLACRGPGQYSTRYGKIEDMVIGLEVVLADGRVVRTGGHGPRSATGPDLTQLFVGSEGTLGVITEGRFRVHPVPDGEGRRAFGFASFVDGLDACRRILRRGATPAVLRLYDQTESGRTFDHPETNALIVLDEADPGLVEATLAVVDEECGGAPTASTSALVERWLGHRNDVSALAPLWRSGIVVDTVEVPARGAPCPASTASVLDALAGWRAPWSPRPTSPTPTPTAPASTSPSPAGHLGRGPAPARRTAGDRGRGSTYYRRAWDEVTGATVAAGGGHQPPPRHRPQPVPVPPPGPSGRASGCWPRSSTPSTRNGILNPGKLGPGQSLGEVPWP